MKDKLKLGLGIMCWEDPTWLYPICRELREICSHITIGWQKYSYYGKTLDNDTLFAMYRELDYLKNEGLIDDIIFVKNPFEYDDKLPLQERYIITRDNEFNKRNVLNNHLRNFDCDYIMICDSDEFHFKEDVEYAMNIMYQEGIDTSFSSMKNFICNTHIEYKLHDLNNFLASSIIESPFVLTAPDKNICFDSTKILSMVNSMKFEDIYCYHFPYIRRNLITKYKYYSQPAIWENHNENTFLDEYDFNEEKILERGFINLGDNICKINKCNYDELDNKLLAHLINRR